MPWQLREGLKRRVKGAPARPLVENLDSLPVHKLPIPVLSDARRYIIPHVSLTFPWLSACKVSRDCVELHIPSLHRNELGQVQTFPLKHFRVGYGIAHSFVCDCGRSVRRLYYLNRHIACRRCQNAIYASQSLSHQQRPILQANRIQSFLDGRPRLMRKVRDRLLKRLGEKALRAQSSLGTQARNLWD